jgi:hypothetical protein
LADSTHTAILIRFSARLPLLPILTDNVVFVLLFGFALISCLYFRQVGVQSTNCVVVDREFPSLAHVQDLPWKSSNGLEHTWSTDSYSVTTLQTDSNNDLHAIARKTPGSIAVPHGLVVLQYIEIINSTEVKKVLSIYLDRGTDCRYLAGGKNFHSQLPHALETFLNKFQSSGSTTEKQGKGKTGQSFAFASLSPFPLVVRWWT